MLTDLPTVKSILGLPAGITSQDSALTAWLNAADQAVKDYCDRDFEQTTYPGAAPNGKGDAGYYGGNDSPYLLLRQYPVTAVANVWQDTTGYFDENPSGSFDSTTLLVQGTDYTLAWDGCLPGTTTKCSNQGKLQRIASLWPALRQSRLGRLQPVLLAGNGNIKVQYTAGYPTIPPALVEAVAQIVAVMRASRRTGVPLQSESLGAYSYAMAALTGAPQLGSTRQLLAKWRRVDL